MQVGIAEHSVALRECAHGASREAIFFRHGARGSAQISIGVARQTGQMSRLPGPRHGADDCLFRLFRGKRGYAVAEVLYYVQVLSAANRGETSYVIAGIEKVLAVGSGEHQVIV